MQAFMQSLQMRCPVAASSGIVDRRHRQRADREALALEEIHLRDLFLERAAGQRHAERRLLELAGLAVLEPFEQLSLPWLWHQMQ
jgi:hypothetical protein